MENKYICCLCGKEFEGYGDNPAPVDGIYGNSNKCCSNCNMTFVLPARMEALTHKFELLNKELKGEKHE